MALSVSLAESELTVDPGGFVRTGVTVRNTSAGTERVRLRVIGPAASWSWVVPPEMDVEPGAEVVMSLGFRVQRTPEPAAGILTFDVLAVPAIGHETESGTRGKVAAAPDAKVSGHLTVTPFRDLAVELDPPDARPTVPTEHNLVVENRGNVAVSTSLRASSDDSDLEVALGSATVDAEPGRRIRVPVTLRPGKRPLLQGRSLPYALSAEPEGGEPVTFSGELDHPARFSPVAAGVAILAVVALTFGLQLTLLSSDDSSSTALSAGASSGSTATTGATGTGATSVTVGTADDHGDCPAEAHRDTRATGLTPEQIPSLPADFSFFQVASDDCLPVRWNPCEPIHFVINPANAPPTGVTDTREAFKRLAAATGITYVDGGLTDENTPGNNRAYQPDRYPGRWAPILVHWMGNSRAQGEIQVVGGGFPTQVGDVYVTGNLFLNPNVVTNAQTRTTVAGGFGGEGVTLGRIGPEGVTWGRIILHELAHITGLGHVSVPSNLMYPETSDHTGPAAFSKDDLAGIKYLGKEAGCLETPKPGPRTGPQGGGARRP